MIKQLIFVMLATTSLINIGTGYAQQKNPQAQISIPIRALEGLVYIDFPKNLCEIIAATSSLDGSFSTTVCQRGSNAFFILEKTVGRTSNGEAVSKIMKIRELPQQLAAGEFFMSGGCAFKKDISYNANGIPTSISGNNIFAITKDTGTQPYKVIRAWNVDWDVNRSNINFKEVNINSIACYSPGWLAGE